MIPDLRTRWTGSERMDDPACDVTKLLRTVAQFRTINRLVGRYRTLLTQTFLADMQRDPARTYHAVDLGAGGCDIAVWLLRTARRRGLNLRVTAIDADPRIVAFAHDHYGTEPGLTIRQGDLTELHALLDADYLFMNHVLHHLPDAIIPGLLRDIAVTAKRQWVISDLQRSPAAYAGFSLLGLFFRNSFAHEDGLLSIRRGFTQEELARHLLDANLHHDARVETYHPGRLVLISHRMPPSEVPSGQTRCNGAALTTTPRRDNGSRARGSLDDPLRAGRHA